MDVRRVSAGWEPGPLRCTAELEGDYSIFVDEPESSGGSGSGPQPTDLFLASVASCFTLAIAYSAKKLDFSLTSIRVDVVGTYDGPRFSDIDILAKLGGLDTSHHDRLLRAAQRVCYVTNSLRNPPNITVAAQNDGRA